MAILTADQSNVDAQFKAMQDGDTLVLTGKVLDWRPGKRTFVNGITIDATDAVIGGIYGSAVEGITFKLGEVCGGDKYALGCRFDGARRLSFAGGQASGSDLSKGASIQIIGGSDITVTDHQAKGYKNGIVLIQVERFALSRLSFTELGGDGVDLFGVLDGFVEDVDGHDFTRYGTNHPDLIQLDSPAGGFRTDKVRISRVKGSGGMQGINAFNHPETGDQGLGTILIEDVDLELLYAQGVALNDVDDLTLRRVTTRTAEGAPSQCRINCGSNVKVTREACAVLPGAGKPGDIDPDWIDPRIPPAPVYPDGVTQPMIDFFDARYALKAG